MGEDMLATEEVSSRLETMPGWILRTGKLHRAFKFSDFSEAFAFMTRVAMEAERLNHHPEWRNVWNTVEIDLVTHDAGGITTLDFKLAARIDALLPAMDND